MIEIFQTQPMLAIFMILIVIVSVCFHEICHVLMAAHEGDNTAIEQGYLTFNPLKLMGIQSLLMLILLGIAWGKVPVSPERFKRSISNILVSLVGPLANLFLFFLFFIISYVLMSIGDTQLKQVLSLTYYAAILNFVLLLFNLLPIPPLDGASLLQFFFPQFYVKMMQNKLSQFGMFFLCLILLFNGNYLFICAGYVFNRLIILTEKVVHFLV